jgi:hypothetical protein
MALRDGRERRGLHIVQSDVADKKPHRVVERIEEVHSVVLDEYDCALPRTHTTLQLRSNSITASGERMR